MARMRDFNSWFTCTGLSHAIGAVALCLAFLVPVSAALAASLNDAQRQQAMLLADGTAWVAAKSSTAVGLASRSTQPAPATNPDNHPLGAQTLSVEKQENKAQPESKRVQVYQFHYGLQQARRLGIDPDSNEVIQVKLIASVHLPLNTAEIAYGQDLLSQRTDILDKLREEQLQRGRAPFGELAELDVKASIFEPMDNQHACHLQRCVLFSLFDATRTVFSIEPVVNLQALQVTLLENP